MLAPFIVWRAWRLSALLERQSGWTRQRLRRMGLLEAGFAVTWTAAALAIIHLIA